MFFEVAEEVVQVDLLHLGWHKQVLLAQLISCLQTLICLSTSMQSNPCQRGTLRTHWYMCQLPNLALLAHKQVGLHNYQLHLAFHKTDS